MDIDRTHLPAEFHHQQGSSDRAASHAVEGSPVAVDWIESFRAPVQEASLDDLIGLSNAKREIASIVARILNPEVILAAGGSLPRGVVLYGPPGTGKTTLVRAMAAMLAGPDATVDFFVVPAGELTAARMAGLGAWLAARDILEKVVVLYLDEAEWALDRRDRDHTESSRAVLNAALSVIDGIDQRSSGRVLWVLSTNRQPFELDPALIRSGRIGFRIEVGHPSFAERAALFGYYGARKRALGMDWDRAAPLMGPEHSPAYVQQVLDDALALALADGFDAGDWPHLAEAIERDGKVSEAEGADEAALRQIATHEAGHAVLGQHLGLSISSLNVWTRRGGHTSWEPELRGRSPIHTERDLRDRIVATLGGVVAERILMRSPSTGGSSDLASATRLARAIVETGAWAQSPAVDFDYFMDRSRSPSAMDDRYRAIRDIVRDAEGDAMSLVARLRPHIERVATVALERRHVSGDDLRALLADIPRLADSAAA